MDQGRRDGFGNGRETLRDAGRFAQGTAPGPGRPKGALARSTLVGRQLMEALERGDDEAGLPSALERWSRLLGDPDPAIRLQAERFVFQSLYGRPKETVCLAQTVPAFTPPAMSDEELAIRLIQVLEDGGKGDVLTRLTGGGP